MYPSNHLQIHSGMDSKTTSFYGLLSVVLGCMTSGFAGVYFEMVLKSSKASIWVRNIQLSTIGIFAAFFSCWYNDLEVNILLLFHISYYYKYIS